ncbi:MAG: acyl carrier protein [Nibricoccus sp.]
MSFESLPASPSQLARYPEEAKNAYQRFRTTADAEALGILVVAAVRDFMPKRSLGPQNIQIKDEMRLMEDLGYDSLAVAETVYFFEDLFKVRIENSELMRVRTVGELRSFVSNKLNITKPSA